MTDNSILLQELSNRTIYSSNTRELIASFIGRYKIQLEVSNFSYGEFLFKDLSGRVGTFLSASQRDDLFFLSPLKDYVEIAVLYYETNPMILGFAYRDDIISLGDMAYVDRRSILSLPKTLDFARQCPHIEVHGGIMDSQSDRWECLGCGKTVRV